ncbi:MAG: hypothetical protein EOP24_07910 [Hyphomicrobiales bacterium]|nr:MAG: hypothetical protein EOP24_07910 [Hyphomicrobiales bacterium]
MTLPANLAALRDEAMRTSCEGWAIQKRWVLARGIDRAGPCPMCGGTDRFAIHTKKNTFNCRGCGISGAGVIDLVMATEGVEFVVACEIITGRKAEAEIDPARAEQLRRDAEAAEAKRDADAARYREEARKAAYRVWQTGYPARWSSSMPGPVVSYLRMRGVDFPGVTAKAIGDQVKLLELDRHPWKEKQGSVWTTLHEGPAMLAAVQRADGHFGAIHITWLDLDQPKGKLVLPPIEQVDGDGVVKTIERPTKKVLGAKKGGAIRLYTPEKPHRIVMGEGIETTLTALAHGYERDTAYWAGVDLPNMSGKAARSESGGQVWDQPDLVDVDCFVPPDWCEELVYLCDSDEASTHTEEKVIRGLRRALALRLAARAEGRDVPALQVSYVPPLGEGRDLNDLVRVGA